MITLYHHPFSRAAGVLWSLEEVGEPYELVFVDIRKGDQKGPPVSTLNPMGKIPVLVDGDTVVTEAAAIALYLGDRYALGTLAPKPDDPRRGTYLRWSLFAPSVIEPGAMAKANGWEFKAGQAGWGDFASMQLAIESAVGTAFVLGDMFSMADVILGGTLRYMTRFNMLTASPAVTAYIERISARPALQRADARNTKIMKEHAIG
jgi:glutathione S-transferase